ncbi:MAG: BMP family ABC transporter substrate-binding protein [Chloroflexota bacterium]
MSAKYFRWLVILALVASLFLGGGNVLARENPMKAASLPVCTDPLGCVEIGPTDPIHIAYSLALTGPNADLGIDERNGAEIAMIHTGSQILGHAVQLDGQDSQCTFAGGQAAGTALAADASIVAVIGTTCSGEAQGAMPLLSAAGMSMVSPSNTLTDLTQAGNPLNYPGYLRVSWPDSIQGTVAAQYAWSVMNATTAATIQDESGYSDKLQETFVTKFTALGGTITNQETINSSDTDMSAALGNIAANSPDVIFFPVFMPAGGYIINQARATTGLETTPLIGADGLFDNNVVTTAGSNVEGFKVASPDMNRYGNTYFTDFLPDYLAQFGSSPSSPYHGYAYDAFNIIEDAIEAVAIVDVDGSIQIGRQALRDALYGTTNHTGLTGNLTCNANGDCGDPDIAVYEYHTGQFPPTYIWPTRIGLVTDQGGVEDQSFNYTAYQGLLQANADLNIDGVQYASTGGDYHQALQTCVDAPNELCIAIGFGMATAAQDAADNNPGTKFAILDASYDTPPSNLRGILFNEKQVGYLAGALAAGMTSSNDVGVVAGMQIPPVERFVDGYRNGAQCNGPVDVLVNYTGTFGDPAVGEAAAADMLARGADVIFAAAGVTGNGAILYAAQNGGWSIGVDTDQYLTVFGNGTVAGSDKLLSSAMKRLDNAVYQTIQDLLAGTFSSATVTMDLSNGGVGLAPYHETDSVIPQSVKDNLDAIKAGIISGVINIDYSCRPRFHAEIVENDVFGVDWLPAIDITLDINDPTNGPGVDFHEVKTTDMQGFVMFNSLGALQLAEGMEISMTDGSITKTHTITNLVATTVDPDTETVSGTGTPGAQLNIQHCDSTGCSWRRFVTVQPDATWTADFSVPGGPSSEETNTLDIQPGTRGEALEGDAEGDHTDYLWLVPGNFSKTAPVNGAVNRHLSLNLSWEPSDGVGFYEYCIDTSNDNDCTNWNNVGSATYATITGLLPNQIYYWQVRSSNYDTSTYANGTLAAFWSFKTMAQPKTFLSTATQDGWILESTEISNAGGTMNATATTFNLGDGTADKQYRSILSFNTASLPDTAVITKVTLKIRVYGALVGNNNPFTWGQGLRVDVCKGTFGTSALQLTDFNFNNATNCRLLAGTFGSTPTSGWYSVNLISAARSKINKVGLTQFRLRFYKDDNDDNAADYWRFYSGNYATATLRPTLIIEYYVP